MEVKIEQLSHEALTALTRRMILARKIHRQHRVEREHASSPASAPPVNVEASSTVTDEGSDIGYCRNVVLTKRYI